MLTAHLHSVDDHIDAHIEQVFSRRKKLCLLHRAAATSTTSTTSA